MDSRPTVVSRLPIELLAAIFNHTHLAEVKISHVSHQWRSVAFATHSLWSTIRIGSQWASVDAINAYVARSAPLSIRVSINESTSSRWESYGIAGCVAAFREIARTRVLGIASNHPNPLNEVLKLLPPAAPRLEELSIVCGSEGSPTNPGPEFTTIFPAGAPQLTTLALGTVALSTCGFSLANITAFWWDADSRSFDELHGLPSLMPALEDFTMLACNAHIAPDHSVTLYIGDGVHWQHFLSICTHIFPPPTAITLQGFGAWDLHSLTDDIGESQLVTHTVRTLELDSCDVEWWLAPSHATAFMRLFSALTALKFKTIIPTQFLTGLRFLDEEPCILPLLQRLILVDVKDIDVNLVTCIVRERAAAGMPLTALAVPASMLDKKIFDGLRADVMLEVTD